MTARPRFTKRQSAQVRAARRSLSNVTGAKRFENRGPAVVHADDHRRRSTFLRETSYDSRGPRKPRPRPPTSGALTAPRRPAAARACTPLSGNALCRSTVAASGATTSVQIFSNTEVKPAESGDMRTSPMAPRRHATCCYGGNLSLGSTPSSRRVVQSLERGFTPSILPGARLACCSHSAAA